MKRSFRMLGVTVLLGLAVAAVGTGYCSESKGGDSQAREEALDRLKALPYLQGSKPVPKKVGVTRYDDQAACPGLNFYVSAHAPRAYLMDMQGNVLHKWGIDYKDIWPVRDKSPHNWMRAYPFDNGDLLAIFIGGGQGELVKIDKNSKLIWTYKPEQEHGGCHHDLGLDENGNIYVLSNQRVLLQDYKGLKFSGAFMEDFITVLNPRGEVIKVVPLLDCFINSDYAFMLEKMRRGGDLFHTNSIEIFDGRLAAKAPFYKKGLALISIRYLNAVAVIDLEEKKVVWAMAKRWREQHKPTLLDNGNLLVFDNLGGKNGKSRVVEFNPLTDQIVWQYGDDPPESLDSDNRGSNQRLPNGNTLITESAEGRVFEVTPEKKIVWEFLSPHLTGDNNELIASIPELLRIFPGPDFFLDVSDEKE